MTPKITSEMREALQREPGRPVEVCDDVTQKTYVLLERESADRLFQEWLRSELHIGLEQAARGEIEGFDAELIKAAGRERLRANG